LAERISNEKERMVNINGVPIENQIKVLYFSKNFEGNDSKTNKKLALTLAEETETFLNKNAIS
jgi:hypothetical protein